MSRAGGTRHLPDVTPRQAGALAAGIVLGGAAVVAAVVGSVAAAAVALGLQTTLILAGVVQLRRRYAEELVVLRVRLERALAAPREDLPAAERHRELLDRLDRLEAGQRRILASVEAERLVAAEFRGELLAGETVGAPDTAVGGRSDRRVPH